MSAATSSQPAVDADCVASQSSIRVSPAMRLYRHALESIFAMLELQDLSRALAVSRSWSAAVRSMKSIGATIRREEWLLKSRGKLFRALPPISTLVTGPLLRQLGGIQITAALAATPLTSESLALLAQHAPHLTSLWCDLTPTPAPAPLLLPANLISLHLYLPSTPSGEVNRVLVILAALPALQRLLLCCSVDEDDHEFVDLSLLGSAPSLRDLDIEDLFARSSDLSDRQVAQIRSSLGHLQRFTFSSLDCEALDRLLQPPVTARWQDIGPIDADADTGDLLVTLPTLTKLDLCFDEDTPHANFLSQLPLLTTLMLDCIEFRWHIPATPMLASLLPCTGLTELDLRCAFNFSQVGTLLAALTKLRTLKLACELESLRCFASGPAAQTLEKLWIGQLTVLPLSELVHLYALQRLQSLTIEKVFESVDEATLDSLCPPSALLPRLTKLDCCGRNASGPSFEWTQARLTQ